MDIIDEVTYRWEDSQEAEIIRQAYCNLFDVKSEDARIVMKHLTGMCRWEDESECSDPIISATVESRRSIIRNIKKQLNMKPIELMQGEEDD